jgi:hypothetical protein
LNKFIKENYEKNIQGEVLYSDFYDSLNIYLEERGFRTLSAIAVSRQLKNEGFDIKTITKKDVNGRYILGLKPKINHINDINVSPISAIARVADKEIVNMVNIVNDLSRFVDKKPNKSDTDSIIEPNTDSIAKRKFPDEDEERDLNIEWDEEDE